MRTENERKCQGFMMKGRPACKYCWPKCSPIHPWQFLRANFDWQWWERLRAGKGKVKKGRKVVTLRYTVLATMFSSSMSSRMRLKRGMWEFDQHQERHSGQISKGMSETNLMRKIPEAQGPLVRRRVGLPWRAHPLFWPNLENIWNNKKVLKSTECNNIENKVTHWWCRSQLVTEGGPEQRLVLLTEATTRLIPPSSLGVSSKKNHLSWM